ncbi:PP2C family protein-serine/threonine phosphatase, partial [bacterium]|nr:PP2C family protein-serine/threonine phosphatase [bacterium]
LANQAAVAVENANLYNAAIEKERMDQELAVAAEIQGALLPGVFPDNPDLLVNALTIPCRTVGGDFFDFFYMPDKCYGMVIADVSGKSIPAALLVSTFHGALCAMCEFVESLEFLAERLNDLLVTATPDNKFITAAFVVWNSSTREIVTLSAGHEPLLLVRKNGDIETLGAGGLILGMIPGAKYDSQKTRLEVGDMLCMYTDGVTDRLNSAGDRYDIDRLKSILLSGKDTSPAETVQSIFRELELFAAGEPPPDDQTMVLIKCREISD